MASTALVDAKVSAGRKLIELLDKKRFPVTAALWFYRGDSDEWRLLISSPAADNRGTRASYRQIQEHLRSGRVTPGIKLDEIQIVPNNDPLLALLRTAIRTDGAPSIGSVRFQRNVINNVMIEDALIYRLT